MNSELNRIKEYQKILKTYRDTELDIKAAFIAEDKQTEEYLTSEKAYLTSLRNKFWNYAKKFYPKKRSGLVIKNNSGENMLRYTLDARIEDDFSDGVNEVRILCFETLMTDEEYGRIIKDNIILELNDDSSESKLLGMQIDIDLEDKSKTSDDIQ